jgi:hypothetical protein
MRTSLVLLATLLATAAQAAERRFPATGFDKVRVAGSADVQATTGQSHSVRATGSEGDLDRLDIRVENGTLIVTQKPGSWSWGREGVKVFVTAPALTAASLMGAGDMSVDRLRGDQVSLAVAGSGDLRVAAVDARTANLALSGSGDIVAAGRCRRASMALRGSGDIMARDLACETIDVALMGSGDVSARATGTASLALNGSGDISVTGGARCTTAKRGSGDISCG